MIAERIVAMALDDEDLNDHQALRIDRVLRLAPGRVPDRELCRPHPLSPCGLESRIRRKALIRISEALLDQPIASHGAPPGRVTLDATDEPMHGRQEGLSFLGHHDNR
jgi:hypothetical protein